MTNIFLEIGRGSEFLCMYDIFIFQKKKIFLHFLHFAIKLSAAWKRMSNCQGQWYINLLFRPTPN